MPILEVDKKFNTKEEFKEEKPFRSQEELKTSIIYNKEQPLDNIIRYLKGSKWEVSYFLQIRDVNDTLVPLDTNLAATVQKYNRIDKLILYVQSAISQDEINSVTGEAVINAGFLPNVNDMFIATLVGGREAIFIVTEVNNRTYNLHYAYLVSFKIFAFTDTDVSMYNNLLHKVMKEYTYDKDHLLDFSAPVILKSDYKHKLNLKDSYNDLVDYYFRHFVNHEKNVIALKTTTSAYVDTFLTDFLYKVINRDEHPIMSKLNLIDIDYRDKIPYTIWDVIINKNTRLLKYCNGDLGFIPHMSGYVDVIIRNMHYLNIEFIVGPLPTKQGELYIPIIDISTPKSVDYKIPSDEKKKSYVVGEDVYNLSKHSNFLVEKMLLDYLQDKMLDMEELSILIDQYSSWPTRDQFYLIPILLVFIKDAIQHTFKSL